MSEPDKNPNRGGIRGFLKLGKKDRQVSPLQPSDDGGGTGNNKTDKKTKKEEAKRNKDIEEQGRLVNRNLRRGVRKDLASTTTETCATFCFIFVVGTFLFGGGTALIVSGKENNILDFIVVGSFGIVVGIIFTSAGIVLILKPVYLNYVARLNQAQESMNAQTEGASNTPMYDDVQRTILRGQIADGEIRTRRPSNADLYGEADTTMDPRSNKRPPRLAVPNNSAGSRSSSDPKPDSSTVKDADASTDQLNDEPPVYFLEAQSKNKNKDKSKGLKHSHESFSSNSSIEFPIPPEINNKHESILELEKDNSLDTELYTKAKLHSREDKEDLSPHILDQNAMSSDYKASEDRCDARQLLDNLSLHSNEENQDSDSAIVVVTGSQNIHKNSDLHQDQQSIINNKKDLQSTDTLGSNDGLDTPRSKDGLDTPRRKVSFQRNTPTIILNNPDMISRQQSRSSKTQTPSSVILTYDQYNSDSESKS